MQMRTSRVLRKIAAGGVAGCVKLNLADPRVVEIAAQSGIDSVWIDMEHVPTDWATVENCVRTAKNYDTDVMVRVAKGSYSDLIRPFEADATGIMVPHVMSLQEAEYTVRMTKFHPIGRRPIDGGNQDAAYCRIGMTDYIEQANRERFVCYQIEDPEALPDLEKIAALPGVDMVHFGPGDYSQAIGAPGDMSHPEIARVRKLIADVCRKNSKIAATVAGPGTVKEIAEMGYRYISVGADVVGLTTYFDSVASIFSGGLV